MRPETVLHTGTIQVPEDHKYTYITVTSTITISPSYGNDLASIDRIGLLIECSCLCVESAKCRIAIESCIMAHESGRQT